MKIVALAVLGIFALSSSASGQATDPDAPNPLDVEDDGESTEMPVDDDAPIPFDEDGAAPSGAEEDPNAPKIRTSDDNDDDEQTAGGEYNPLVGRRLTLVSAAGQLRWFGGIGGLTEKRAYRSRKSEEGGLRVGGVLSAQYGITDEIQLGLHYGTGTYGDVDTQDTDDKGYETGKAAAIEVHYGLYSWLAIQVELPMLLDPFEMGLTVGIPMKFRFGDKLAVFVGEDLFTVRFTDMVPFVEDAVSNTRARVEVDASTNQDLGDITVKGGVIYQLSPRAAFRGTFGIVAADFEMQDSGTVLWGDLIYSLSERLDLEARAGFANISEPGDTFTLAVGAAFRI